jgi:hypothetical protein
VQVYGPRAPERMVATLVGFAVKSD